MKLTFYPRDVGARGGQSRFILISIWSISVRGSFLTFLLELLMNAIWSMLGLGPGLGLVSSVKRTT